MKSKLKRLNNFIKLVKNYTNGLVSSLSVIRNGDVPQYLEVDPKRYEFNGSSYIGFYKSLKKEVKKFKLRNIDYEFRELYYLGHTQNNIKEFEFFYNKFSDSLSVSDVPTDKNNLALCTETVTYRASRSMLNKVAPLIACIVLLLNRTRINRTVLHYVLQYSYHFIYYYENFRLNKTILPKVVVFSNDHTPKYLAASKVLKFFSVKRIYLQHGFVSELFPKLDFELSILWNEKSKEVYKKVGSEIDDSVVSLSRENGDAGGKVASASNIGCDNSTIDVIVFPTSLPELKKVNELIELLATKQYINSIYVKPHPRYTDIDKISKHAELIDSYDSFGGDFVAIVGNSSIAMELSLKGIRVFQNFETDSIGNDYYGFVKNKLTQEISLLSMAESDSIDIFSEYTIGRDVINKYCPIRSGHQDKNIRIINEFLIKFLVYSVRGSNKLRTSKVYNSDSSKYKLIKVMLEDGEKEEILTELVEHNVISHDERIVLSNTL